VGATLNWPFVGVPAYFWEPAKGRLAKHAIGPRGQVPVFFPAEPRFPAEALKVRNAECVLEIIANNVHKSN
jgi:hypothetical protein